jgi:hypothetical protein
LIPRTVEGLIDFVAFWQVRLKTLGLDPGQRPIAGAPYGF